MFASTCRAGNLKASHTLCTAEQSAGVQPLRSLVGTSSLASNLSRVLHSCQVKGWTGINRMRTSGGTAAKSVTSDVAASSCCLPWLQVCKAAAFSWFRMVASGTLQLHCSCATQPH